ncbi:extracellular solute-binding protein [Clostridium amylolyticum]|uniref:Extracellular solute-binding protein n=1 Tax=Clostridium amylolyticum TaxID=1121298 RepID=A0A1M6EAY8_9CLOT|nr:extracellular solute-binding protein [Clostridium amylolyticum]SHI82642.1 extracellular solute-binding protein [Clostridium amylolyticum]
MLDKIKHMSKKEKMEYIWDYYKIHILVGVFIIIAVSWTIYTNVNKTEYVFNCTLLGEGVNLSKKAEFEDKLTKIVLEEPEDKKQAYMDFIEVKGSSSVENSIDPYAMQKLSARVAAGDIDIFIVDEKNFQRFAMQGMFEILDSFSELDLSDKNAVKIEKGSEDVKSGIYGVRVKDNASLKDMGYSTEDKIAGIVTLSKNKDKGAAVLKWLQEDK